MEKKITKALVMEVLDKINEKDFLRIIESVDGAILEYEKARTKYRQLSPATATVREYNDAENRVKVGLVIKANKLKEFYDLFTERVKTFNGMSVIRKKKDESPKEPAGEQK